MPYMWFLFVGPRVCIRLPSDSASRRTPLPFANSSYCQACSGLSPQSYRPCWAHIKKALDIKKHPEHNRPKNLHIKSSSPIQTLLSVLEFHQVNRFRSSRTFTAGREFHPALKNILSSIILIKISHTK